MILNLTDLSNEPLQRQIIRQIRALILSGELAAGADLPSIRSLAREQHVSVITVQRAYESLMNEGVIHSRRGKGFFVSELPGKKKKEMAVERFSANLAPIVSAAFADGLTVGDIKHMVKQIIDRVTTSLTEDNNNDTGV